jgi:hypothetical protein
MYTPYINPININFSIGCLFVGWWKAINIINSKVHSSIQSFTSYIIIDNKGIVESMPRVFNEGEEEHVQWKKGIRKTTSRWKSLF